MAIYSFEKYDEAYLASGLRSALGADNVKALSVALSADTARLADGCDSDLRGRPLSLEGAALRSPLSLAHNLHACRCVCLPPFTPLPPSPSPSPRPPLVCACLRRHPSECARALRVIGARRPRTSLARALASMRASPSRYLSLTGRCGRRQLRGGLPLRQRRRPRAGADMCRAAAAPPAAAARRRSGFRGRFTPRGRGDEALLSLVQPSSFSLGGMEVGRDGRRDGGTEGRKDGGTEGRRDGEREKERKRERERE